METARLALRRFTAADTAALAAYRTDPEVSRYQSWDSPVPLEEAERLVADFSAADPREPGWFQYAVERRDAAGLIGDLGVCRSENGRQAALGFASKFQGRGYAAETEHIGSRPVRVLALRVVQREFLVESDDEGHRPDRNRTGHWGSADPGGCQNGRATGRVAGRTSTPLSGTADGTGPGARSGPCTMAGMPSLRTSLRGPAVGCRSVE
jgi:hypothetical protein